MIHQPSAASDGTMPDWSIQKQDIIKGNKETGFPWPQSERQDKTGISTSIDFTYFDCSSTIVTSLIVSLIYNYDSNLQTHDDQYCVL